MARDILGEYGPDSGDKQVARAGSGGGQTAKDVRSYQSPQGPSTINNPQSPGLHGKVYPSGSQTAGIQGSESGGPGLGGERKKSGSQR
jgi:hypothetical protein